MQKEKIDNFISIYLEQKQTYDDFSKKINSLVEELLKEKFIQCHSINSRSKEVESLRKKISKPEKEYDSISDITDLCGIRIITYFSNDVDNVAKIIEKEFNIDRKNSIDKRHENDPDRFGYLSLHYVAQLSNKRDILTEYKKFKDLKFEIQIRSILQHAWAEIEHDIGYKSELALPREFRRRFARVSGLLEIADNEFNELRSDLSRYRKSVDKNILIKSKIIDINSITLKSFIQSNEKINILENSIISDHRLIKKEVSNENLEAHVKRLNFLNIKTINEAQHLIDRHSDKVKKFYIEARRDHKLFQSESIVQGFTLLYAAYIEAIQNDDPDYLIKLLRSFSKAPEKYLIDISSILKSSYEKINK